MKQQALSNQPLPLMGELVLALSQEEHRWFEQKQVCKNQITLAQGSPFLCYRFHGGLGTLMGPQTSWCFLSTRG